MEPLTPKEIQGRNMTLLLAEIAVEEKEEEFKTVKDVLLTILQEQMTINQLLKQRGLETEVRKQHLSRKASIQAKLVEARRKRDDCDIQLKQLKASQKTASAKETEVRKKRGQDEKRLRQGIENNIVTDYNVSTSA
jgi:hypothetical protein